MRKKVRLHHTKAVFLGDCSPQNKDVVIWTQVRERGDDTVLDERPEERLEYPFIQKFFLLYVYARYTSYSISKEKRNRGA